MDVPSWINVGLPYGLFISDFLRTRPGFRVPLALQSTLSPSLLTGAQFVRVLHILLRHLPRKLLRTLTFSCTTSKSGDQIADQSALEGYQNDCSTSESS
ncbi:hypothetical protein U1Q18_004543, partial [Sarracenia purpurea var. burkii]